ncbi:MAG: hypothetical protein LBL69_02025, partial [Zoogloeaceae bacterium]|nr:hypothetical protein [Zoogloeaceae bacterium]
MKQTNPPPCHCERSEAIHTTVDIPAPLLDCFVASLLAMTRIGNGNRRRIFCIKTDKYLHAFPNNTTCQTASYTTLNQPLNMIKQPHT